MSNVIQLNEQQLDVGALFDAHGAYLVRAVSRLTGGGQAAEDIVQEVFILAHQRRHELVDKTGIRTWLYRVAVNRVRHGRRSYARYHRMLDRYKTQPEEGKVLPDGEASKKERGELIQRCILELSEKQREVFVLYELEQLEGSEIADILGISVNTVWSRLRLARTAFRKIWGSTVGEER